jgi:hypothetical protein
MQNVDNAGINSYASGLEGSTLPQNLKAKYEEIYHRLQDAFGDMLAKHRAILEARSRQTEEERALNPIPPLLSWWDRPIPQQTDDKSSTPERSQ